MSFTSRQATDLAKQFGEATAREGRIFSELVTVIDEAGNSVQAYMIPYDPFDPTSAKQTQKRTMRFQDTLTVARGYKITQVLSNETIYWFVKDVRNDHEGLLYVKCERAVAKG